MSDVAKVAGVSTMTVSRALSGNTKVSEQLRQRVLNAVAKLNYQPNEIARSLREQRSRQIGVIVPYLLDPFFALCAHAVSQVAKAHAFSMVLSTSNEDARTEFEEACQMQRRNVAGLVIIPAARHSPPHESLLMRPELQSVPIALIDKPVEGSRFDGVLVNNAEGGRMGTRHLLGLGHKRIAFVGFKADLYTLRMRFQGYAATMQEAGLSPVEATLSGVLDDSLSTVRRLLEKRSPPSALFCGNNLIARHVLHALKALGYTPPKPVSLVTFDDFETADLIHPGITVVRQPGEAMSRLAAQMLFDRLSGKASGEPQRLSLPVELVVRGSCGATNGVPAA